MRTLRRGYDAVMVNLLVAILVLLLALMGTQVVLRYGFSSSLIWAEETCRYLLVWASFLAVTLAYERGEIASVTMLRDALPRRAGLALAMLANLFGIVLLVVLIHYGIQYAQRLGSQPIPGMGFLLRDLFGPDAAIPPIYWVYIALPVGLGMFAIRLAVDILLYARMMRDGGTASDLRLRPETETV